MTTVSIRNGYLLDLLPPVDLKCIEKHFSYPDDLVQVVTNS